MHLNLKQLLTACFLVAIACNFYLPAAKVEELEDKSDYEIIIPGEILRACLSTYMCKSNSIGDNSKYGPSPIHLSGLDDYDIHVNQDSDTYKIVFFTSTEQVPES